MEEYDSVLNALTEWAKRADSGFTVTKSIAGKNPDSPDYVLQLVETPATYNGESGAERVSRIMQHFEKAKLDADCCVAPYRPDRPRTTEIVLYRSQPNLKPKVKTLLENALSGDISTEESNAQLVRKITRAIIKTNYDGTVESPQQAADAIIQPILALKSLARELKVGRIVEAATESKLPPRRGR